MEEPSQFSVGQTAQSLTCSIMEKPHTGLDDCLRMLQECFRKTISESDARGYENNFRILSGKCLRWKKRGGLRHAAIMLIKFIWIYEVVHTHPLSRRILFHDVIMMQLCWFCLLLSGKFHGPVPGRQFWNWEPKDNIKYARKKRNRGGTIKYRVRQKFDSRFLRELNPTARGGQDTGSRHPEWLWIVIKEDGRSVQYWTDRPFSSITTT